MFESITEGLSGALQKLTSRGRITEKDVDDGLREVRRALLEADVNLSVVKGFTERIRERSLNADRLRTVEGGQQVVKIVHDELVNLLGPVDHRFNINPKGPTVIMMVGLQGCGKTTSCGKLAQYLLNKGKRPLLVAADVQRPAAIDQLRTLGRQLDVPVYHEAPGWLRGKPPKICVNGIKQAELTNRDYVILDTAGRLHIDEELMNELRSIKKQVMPQNVFLVSDAMTGQDAVNSAKEFDARLDIHSVILTKMDGDARGGAALSIKAVTGKPVKFIGVGEKLDRLEEFHPDRMASRLLGMGDIVSLVEKAQETVDTETAEKSATRLMEGRWNFNDFLDQLKNLKKMGPFKDLMGMIPGVGQMMKDVPIQGDEMKYIEAIILSMTNKERRQPDLLNGSRRRRVARGSGTSVQEVNQLIKQFKQMKKAVRMMSRTGDMNSLLQGMLGGRKAGRKALGGLGLGGGGMMSRPRRPKKFR